MKNGHRPKLRSCAHCGRQFVVDPRVGKRHRFCSRPECVRASRRTAQQKWLRKNGGNSYFAGKENLEKVRAWRKHHPQYWKRTSRRKGARSAAFRLSKSLQAALRCVALQDVIEPRLALEIGIIARLSGAALQDTIASEISATMLRGYAILNAR